MPDGIPKSPTHLGRFHASSPSFSPGTVDSRRGRPLDSYTQHVRDSEFIVTDYPSGDVGGQSVPTDDQADDYSDYGSYDPAS